MLNRFIQAAALTYITACTPRIMPVYEGNDDHLAGFEMDITDNVLNMTVDVAAAVDGSIQHYDFGVA